MLRAMGTELGGAGSAKRLATWLIAATVLVACSAQSAASPASARANDTSAACLLVHFAQSQSGIPIEAGHKVPVVITKAYDSCYNVACWTWFKNPANGSKECKYGRLATVVVDRAASKKLASSFVSQYLHKGFQPVKTGADVAGIVVSSIGASVLLAVGRVKITYTLSANVGQGESNPGWPGDKQDAVKGAREIVRILRRRPQCPVDPDKCA
jgi:hypothetical protein